jgi:hypothetical protein
MSAQSQYVIQAMTHFICNDEVINEHDVLRSKHTTAGSRGRAV